jgi:hypothetical protein
VELPSFDRIPLAVATDPDHTFADIVTQSGVDEATSASRINKEYDHFSASLGAQDFLLT